jgi:hypothetical protein
LFTGKIKQTLLIIGIFTFLFHSVVPYFYSASSKVADISSTTICTAYGYKTVFLTTEEDASSNKLDNYYECPTCIVQANAIGWIDSYGSLFGLNISQKKESWIARLPLTPYSATFPIFLSRAPPTYL